VLSDSTYEGLTRGQTILFKSYLKDQSRFSNHLDQEASQAAFDKCFFRVAAWTVKWRVEAYYRTAFRNSRADIARAHRNSRTESVETVSLRSLERARRPVEGSCA
jgi:hypothetical protein